MCKRASTPDFVRFHEGAEDTGNDIIDSFTEGSSSKTPGGSRPKVELAQESLLEEDSEDEDPEMAFFRSMKMKEEERASTSRMR
jgi:hypothetical protein